MEDEKQDGQQGAEEAGRQAGDMPGQAEPDYKALYEATLAASRKWEGRAKKNAADLRQTPSTTELEEAVSRADAAEARVAELEAQQAYAQAVAEVARDSGLPESVVRSLRGATSDELREAAGSVRSAIDPYEPTRDRGEGAKRPVTRESIMAIKDRDARMDAVEANPELFRR